jgi:hypothetical protein
MKRLLLVLLFSGIFSCAVAQSEVCQPQLKALPDTDQLLKRGEHRLQQHRYSGVQWTAPSERCLHLSRHTLARSGRRCRSSGGDDRYCRPTVRKNPNRSAAMESIAFSYFGRRGCRRHVSRRFYRWVRNSNFVMGMP